jgi:hypothetical protein
VRPCLKKERERRRRQRKLINTNGKQKNMTIGKTHVLKPCQTTPI